MFENHSSDKMENIENIHPSIHQSLNQRGVLDSKQQEQRKPAFRNVLQPRNKVSEACKADKKPLKTTARSKFESKSSALSFYHPVQPPSKSFSVFEDETTTNTQSSAISVLHDDCHTKKPDRTEEKNVSCNKEDIEDASDKLENTNIEDKENSGDVSMYSQSNMSPMVVDPNEESVIKKEVFGEDTLCPKEYEEDMYKYLRTLEVQHRPKPFYMQKQQDINFEMRCILVDWLVEVAEEYRLETETLFLTVHYVDRFLSFMSVDRSKLQLVGAAAMFIAGKFEEIYPPDVSEFVYITDDTYTKKQMLRMEHLMLKVLSFDLAAPTAQRFLIRYVQVSKLDSLAYNLALYLAELTLLHSEPFLMYNPSVIAASSLCVANVTLGNETWSEFMVKISGYSLGDLVECATHIHLCFLKAGKFNQQATRDKYKSPKHNSVSLFTPPSTLPWMKPQESRTSSPIVDMQKE